MDAYPLVILFCNYRTTHEDSPAPELLLLTGLTGFGGGGGVEGRLPRSRWRRGRTWAGGGGGVAKDRGGKEGVAHP